MCIPQSKAVTSWMHPAVTGSKWQRELTCSLPISACERRGQEAAVRLDRSVWTNCLKTMWSQRRKASSTCLIVAGQTSCGGYTTSHREFLYMYKAYENETCILYLHKEICIISVGQCIYWHVTGTGKKCNFQIHFSDIIHL